MWAAVIALVAAGLWPVAAAGADDCTWPAAEFSTAFDGLGPPGSDYVASPICVADVGPGLAGADAGEFTTLAAADITNALMSPDELMLGAVVGTLESGSAEEYVAALVSRLGPEAARGTVEIAGRTVHYLDLVPDGPRGYAYGEGATVVVAYVRPSLDPPAHPQLPLVVMSAVAAVIEKNTTGPVPAVPSPMSTINMWPLARGDFASSTDPGWVFFRTDDKGDLDYHCGIGPNGSVAGCDFGFVMDHTPAGTNQISLDSSGTHQRHADTPTFTRPGVDVLPMGERIENGPAACTVTGQGPVACRLADGSYGILR